VIIHALSKLKKCYKYLVLYSSLTLDKWLSFEW
jgi:hypothetical protein